MADKHDDNKEAFGGQKEEREFWSREGWEVGGIYENLDLDKVGDLWVLRYFPNAEEVVLQLTIRQYLFGEPTEYACEIRMGESVEFVELTRFISHAPGPPCSRDFPEAWREAYAAMWRVWARLNDHVRFTPPPGDWWKGLPVIPEYVPSNTLDATAPSKRTVH